VTLPLAYGLVLAGLCCVASTILLEFKSCEAGAAELSGQIFAYLGKFFVAGTFQAIYIHTAEAYSTDVRADCIGLCSVSARLGGIIAPFVLSTADVASWMPGMMFGVVREVTFFKLGQFMEPKLQLL
jgi:OCT family organic cation transporter-like MFS transporter 4/5